MNLRRPVLAATLVLLLLVGIVVVSNRNPDRMVLDPSPLLDHGVAMVMVCGKQPTRETVNMTAEAVVRSEWAGERWTRHRRGNCVFYYHHPRNVD